VLTHRYLIASLVFVWSLGGILNAFAHCRLENHLPAKTSVQIPVSISCLDNQDHPFLAQVIQRDKKIHFSKIEKRPTDIYHTDLLPEGAFHLTPFPSSASILVSVPIYQLKNVYRV
jgi:hypothetical protein